MPRAFPRHKRKLVVIEKLTTTFGRVRRINWNSAIAEKTVFEDCKLVIGILGDKSFFNSPTWRATITLKGKPAETNSLQMVIKTFSAPPPPKVGKKNKYFDFKTQSILVKATYKELLVNSEIDLISFSESCVCNGRLKQRE